jgi:leucyl-tRNA synthetase
VLAAAGAAPKARDRGGGPRGAHAATLEQLALESEAVQRSLSGREIRKVIVRAPKLVNIVPG